MEIYNETFCVYIHTNKINGKMYVGQTIYGNNPNKRWLNGYGYSNQKLFYRAIQKYGWDNFEHEVIASNLTKQEADNFETLLIDKLKTSNPNFGYNITLGGGGSVGYHATDAAKKKHKITMQKYYSDPLYIQQMRDSAPKRSVYQFTTNGFFVDYYISMMEAQRQTGIRNSVISHCAHGRIPSAGGYIFVFEEDLDKIEQRIDRYVSSKKPKKDRIVQLSLNLEFISEWASAADAGKTLNINYKNIHTVCRGQRNHAGGYKWMYLSDYQQLHKF